MKLDKKFYERDSERVARKLLGKNLIHKQDDKIAGGRIVETEAYYGKEDPASRASKKKTKINRHMWKKGGISLVYMVHGNWLFNITTEGPDIPGAVLIRALEPIHGQEIMKKRRTRSELKHLTSGPGKLTQALRITKDQNDVDVTESDNLYIEYSNREESFRIGTSNRIGVSEDLDRELRFFVDDNRFVSC